MGQELAGAALALADDRAATRPRSRWSAARPRRSAPTGTRPARTTPWCRRWPPAGTASWALWGSSLSAWETCCTASLLPTLLMTDSRIAGTTRKKKPPSSVIGSQKSFDWRELLQVGAHHGEHALVVHRVTSGNAPRPVPASGARRSRRMAKYRSSSDGLVRVDPGEAHAGRGERRRPGRAPAAGRRAAPRCASFSPTGGDHAGPWPADLRRARLGSSASSRTMSCGPVPAGQLAPGCRGAGRCRPRAR